MWCDVVRCADLSVELPRGVPVSVSYTLLDILFISPNSFSYRGSYFKYRGEGSQNFWIRFGGGCRAGCRPRCRLIFSWWRIWVSVRRFFGFVLGQQVSSCNAAKLLFCVCRCFAS